MVQNVLTAPITILRRSIPSFPLSSALGSIQRGLQCLDGLNSGGGIATFGSITSVGTVSGSTWMRIISQRRRTQEQDQCLHSKLQPGYPDYPSWSDQFRQGRPCGEVNTYEPKISYRL